MDPVTTALIGWATSQVGNAGVHGLKRLLLGDRQQNALRAVVGQAIGASVEAVVAKQDRSLVREALLQESADSPEVRVEDVVNLRDAVLGQVGPRLETLAEQGYDVDAGRLAEVLARNIAAGIQADALRDGPLAPLAELLRHERVAATGEETVEQLREVNRTLAGALAGGAAHREQAAAVSEGQSGPAGFSAPAPVALAGLPAEEGFVGRGNDLSVLDEILAPDAGGAEAVIVSTVAGLAGVGKTAFAVRAARRALNAGWFPGGVVFVDLHGYDPALWVDADAALGALLRALSVPNGQIPPERGERETLYRSKLAELAGLGQRVLIVADNASTLEQVAPLRPGSAVHRMLVTSRDNLPLHGARRIEMDILSQAEAVAVVERALRAASPGDSRIADDTQAANRLVELCGRLPLALRITAELLADEPEQPVAGMVEVLSDARGRLAEIAYGDSLAVRAAFDASYQRLSSDQQRLFRLLALNAGPHIGHGAAAALADVPEPVARRTLAALRRAHLIQAAPVPGSYGFHDLLRLYARERCEQHDPSPERHAAVVRLLGYYLENVRAADRHLDPDPGAHRDPDTGAGLRLARFTDRTAALAWLNAERPNLVAAVSLAADGGHDSYARDIALGLFNFFDLRKHWAAWIATHQIALAAARRLGNRHSEGVVLNNLGVAYRQRRLFEDALACHDQALSICQAIGDLQGVGRALNNSGITYRDLRRFDDALAFHQRAITVCADIGDRHGEAEALDNLGNTYRELRRFDDALACYQQAISIYQEIGDRYGEGWAVNGEGVAHRELHRFDDALGSLQRARAICREISDRYGEGWAVNGIGNTYRELRRFDDALGSLQQALAIRREIGDRHGEAHTLTNLGTLYRDLGQFDEALGVLQQALAIRREIGDSHGEGVTLRGLGDIHRDMERFDAALTSYQQALAAYEENNAPDDAKEVLRAITELTSGR